MFVVIFLQFRSVLFSGLYSFLLGSLLEPKSIYFIAPVTVTHPSGCFCSEINIRIFSIQLNTDLSIIVAILTRQKSPWPASLSLNALAILGFTQHGLFFFFCVRFNYRSTHHLTTNGFYEFLNWFDERAWYPLGRIVGGTVSFSTV